MSEHWCGIFSGVCTSNADPLKQGRLRVQVPAVLGQQDLAEWALPCRLPGAGALKDHVFTDNDTGEGAGGSATERLKHEYVQPLPKPGELVWVLFEGGDVDRPVWMGVQ